MRTKPNTLLISYRPAAESDEQSTGNRSDPDHFDTDKNESLEFRPQDVRIRS